MNQEQTIWTHYPAGPSGMQVPANQFMHAISGSDLMPFGQPVMLTQWKEDPSAAWMMLGMNSSPKPAREYMSNPAENYMAAPPSDMKDGNNMVFMVPSSGSANTKGIATPFDSFNTVDQKDGMYFVSKVQTHAVQPQGNIPVSASQVPVVFLVQNGSKFPNPNTALPANIPQKDENFNRAGMVFHNQRPDMVPHMFPPDSVASKGSQHPGGRITPSYHQVAPSRVSQKDPGAGKYTASTLSRGGSGGGTYSGPQAWVNRGGVWETLDLSL